MKRIIVAISFFILLAFIFSISRHGLTPPRSITIPNISPVPKVQLTTPPPAKKLPGTYHVFQSFNNCGPAALSMALSYYNINVSQEELGQALRPFQNPGGDNDDKSVTLEELAEKSKDYGFIPYHRPQGNIEVIKQFISYDMPVITRTWLKENEDIGHYRVVKGYDENRLLQDDSLQGKNLWYTPEEFNIIWQQFNYEFLVLVPKDKKDIADAILEENADAQTAWKNAVDSAQSKLKEDPDDIYARFNLSVAYYEVGEFQKSVEEFEKIENRLPFRTLWYQIEPIKAYYELGNYDRVFSITDKILNNHNRAYAEAYLIRGEIYKKQGNTDAARSEFEKAVFYNKNLKAAQEALNQL